MKHIITLFLFLVAVQLHAQERTFSEAAVSLSSKVEQSRIELTNEQRIIREEKSPLTERLRELENAQEVVKKEYDEVLRQRDTRSLDISSLKTKVDNKKKQNDYLAGLIDDYVSQFESRLHIGEVQRYKETINKNKNAAANSNLSLNEKFEARMKLLELTLDRTEEAIGGAIYEGSAINADGVVGTGRFVQLGPIAWFAGNEDTHMGIADARLGSNEPSLIDVPEETKAAMVSFRGSDSGILPIDSTRGTAQKIVEVQETTIEQIKKGGAVMWPLLILAAISILVGLIKWVQLLMVQRMSPKRFNNMMICLVNGQKESAGEMASKVRGPIGTMLSAAVDHWNEPREMLEEVLYEKVLDARTKLNSFIPFIKITAAAAPLLGLLGTVSGMINTFKLITVLGTSDAQNFSSGISEALITTQWGLIVAIPALMLAAFLARKAKTVLDDMEKLSIRFMNQIPEPDDKEDTPPAPPKQENPAPGDELDLEIDLDGDALPQT